MQKYLHGVNMFSWDHELFDSKSDSFRAPQYFQVTSAAVFPGNNLCNDELELMKYSECSCSGLSIFVTLPTRLSVNSFAICL